MEYEALVRLAKSVAACAVKARILGRDSAAYLLAQAGDELERAAIRLREEKVREELVVEEGVAG